MSPGCHRPAIAITGIGVLSPFGAGIQAYTEGLRQGRCAIKPVADYGAGGQRIARFAPFVGYYEEEIVKQELGARGITLSALEGFFANAVLAAVEAVDAATGSGSRPCGERTGVSVGTAFGQLRLVERWAREGKVAGGDKLELAAYRAEMLPKLLAQRFGFSGPCHLFSVACASSNFAIGNAVDLIRRGSVDAMLCGGAEAFQESSLAGAAALGVVDREPCRPFSACRSGFNPGIGAAFLLLESAASAVKRGATVLAEVLGFGASSDACHLTAPDMDGEGMARAMTAALADAGIAPERVDYINAHGTGTYINDLVETRAIKRVFYQQVGKIPVSATKSQIGHCAGASAALEAVACCFAVRCDRLPPTLNYSRPDPDCDLDYVPNQGREKTVNLALNNSFAFGGHNSCLLIAKSGQVR